MSCPCRAAVFGIAMWATQSVKMLSTYDCLFCRTQSFLCSEHKTTPFSSLSETRLSSLPFPLHSQILLTQQSVPELPGVGLMLGCQVIQLQPAPRNAAFKRRQQHSSHGLLIKLFTRCHASLCKQKCGIVIFPALQQQPPSHVEAG